MSNNSKMLAPGGPGLAPRWTRGAKEAVGTAYSNASRVWYTVAAGILTEVFYPTIDTPQIRDLQYLMTDGATFFHDERRHTRTTLECVDEAALGFRLTNEAKNGLYTIRKTLIGHPYQDCVLIHTKFEAEPWVLDRLQVYVLCAPHLEIGGWHNNAEVVDTKGGRILLAYKGSTWMALGATVSFTQCSCGYVAVNDGWTDLKDNFKLDWEYDAALDGNVAVTGRLDLSRGPEFTLGLAFGNTRHRAIANLFQSLVTPFAENLQRFEREWDRTAKRFALAAPLEDPHSTRLFKRSVNVLLAHEDKRYAGAMIAALSIPWGSSKGDEELGGYHLVWTRDLVQAATGLLAAGDIITPLRVLVYLAVSQREDGGFYQNFWLDGRSYWSGIQLDEVAFPVVLAWRLKRAGALGHFDPGPMVMAAARFLLLEGPASAQDRWEEVAGYSPSTLAIGIAALLCAADLIEDDGDRATASFIRDHADFVEANIERWTVTTDGTLVNGIKRHFIRCNPDTRDEADPNSGTVILANQAPGGPYAYPAKDIVDAGFLELVRYGVRAAGDPLIEDSLHVIDAVLKVDTPGGPCWHRYNHDGYGQRKDGTSYRGWGVGRLWPLLTGERGHYELAAGRSAMPYAKAMENFSVGIGLIPEQIWDQEAIPEKLLYKGGPTGAAIPLLWAHAEYVKLVRSIADGQVFDRLPPVHARYVDKSQARGVPVVCWRPKRPVISVPRGQTLRILEGEPFTLRWTGDNWQTMQDAVAQATAIGVWFVDLTQAQGATAPFEFTFQWTSQNRWEGRNYTVRIQ